jgi:NAD(P)-dependent dehydrogenase (short-subunit alcohol dehydrogenase family)
VDVGDRLVGRVALVTGAGRGIGRAIALRLAREGADVAVTSRTESEIAAVATEVRGFGRSGVPIRADAMSAAESREAVNMAIDALGRLDILVNNVGGVVAPNGLAELSCFGHDDQRFLDNLTLNLFSAHWTIQQAIPHMQQQGYGRILNIGSGYSHHSGGLLAYTVAKHGVVGLTRVLAAHLAPHGITVNCLCPGWTNTKLLDWDALALIHGTDVAGVRHLAERTNLQHRILEPEEIAPMAALLASEESSGVTGQIINVDGGYMV